MTKTPDKKRNAHASLPLFTRPQIAEALGVNPFTVTRWEHEIPPLPIAEPGGAAKATRYALPAVIAWWKVRELAKFEGDAGGDSKDTALAKQATANTERIKLDLKRRRGEVFYAKIALEAWSGMVTAFRAGALALPRALAEVLVRLAPQGVAAVEAKLTEAIWDLLTTLSGWHPPATADEPEGDDSPPAEAAS